MPVRPYTANVEPQPTCCKQAGGEEGEADQPMPLALIYARQAGRQAGGQAVGRLH